MKLEPKSRKRISHEETLALWKKYRETNDPQLRNRIVLTFAPLVKYIVYNKIRELPARCEVDDFISCGLEALINSIDRYDPEKGATLEQYAWTRIHGAVLDELRRQDWAPRSLRRWERDIARARERFTANHGRQPTVEELADAMGTTPEELRARQGEISASDVTSLNTLVLSEEDTNVERIDTIVSEDRGADPEAAAMSEAAKARFRRAFSALPEREREVAVLLYVKNLTLREIGEILAVSESRVCQIHSELKRKLREALKGEAGLFSQGACARSPRSASWPTRSPRSTFRQDRRRRTSSRSRTSGPVTARRPCPAASSRSTTSVCRGRPASSSTRRGTVATRSSSGSARVR